MHPHKRMGVTLVELLVCVGIIGLIVALLLPAINNARGRARQSQCSSNVRELALAINAFESAHQRFPPGVSLCSGPLLVGGTDVGNVCAGPNWATLMLPYLDEENLWNSVTECMREQWNACDDCEHEPWRVGRTTPTTMVCPSAPANLPTHFSHRTGLENLAKGNYAACYGSWKYGLAIENGPTVWEPQGAPKDPGVDGPSWQEAIGVLSVATMDRRGYMKHNDPKDKGSWKLGTRLGTRTSEVSGGLSKTLLLSEVVGCDDKRDIRGVWTSGAMGAAAFCAYTGPNAEPGILLQHPKYATEVIQGDLLFGCGPGAARFLTCHEMEQNGDHYAAARSKHAGGVVAAHADGSVTTYPDDVDLLVWQELASRN